eukprot:403337707
MLRKTLAAVLVFTTLFTLTPVEGARIKSLVQNTLENDDVVTFEGTLLDQLPHLQDINVNNVGASRRMLPQTIFGQVSVDALSQVQDDVVDIEVTPVLEEVVLAAPDIPTLLFAQTQDDEVVIELSPANEEVVAEPVIPTLSLAQVKNMALRRSNVNNLVQLSSNVENGSYQVLTLAAPDNVEILTPPVIDVQVPLEGSSEDIFSIQGQEEQDPVMPTPLG